MAQQQEQKDEKDTKTIKSIVEDVYPNDDKDFYRVRLGDGNFYSHWNGGKPVPDFIDEGVEVDVEYTTKPKGDGDVWRNIQSIEPTGKAEGGTIVKDGEPSESSGSTKTKAEREYISKDDRIVANTAFQKAVDYETRKEELNDDYTATHDSVFLTAEEFAGRLKELTKKVAEK